MNRFARRRMTYEQQLAKARAVLDEHGISRAITLPRQSNVWGLAVRLDLEPQEVHTFPEATRHLARADSDTVGIYPTRNHFGSRQRRIPHEGRTTNITAIRTTGARVLAMVDVPINHWLIGDIKPGDDPSKYTLFTKDAARIQCAEDLEALGIVDTIDTTSTASAVKALAEGQLGKRALVIASRAAADEYGMPAIRPIGPENNATEMAIVAPPGVSHPGLSVAAGLVAVTSIVMNRR